MNIVELHILKGVTLWNVSYIKIKNLQKTLEIVGDTVFLASHQRLPQLGESLSLIVTFYK